MSFNLQFRQMANTGLVSNYHLSAISQDKPTTPTAKTGDDSTLPTLSFSHTHTMPRPSSASHLTRTMNNSSTATPPPVINTTYCSEL